MHLRSTFSVLFIFFSFLAQAQSVKLSGKVVNEKNDALPGVSILVNGGKGSASGSDGAFHLSLEPGKKYELTFTAIGYESKIISEVEVIAGQVNELNVTLKTASREEAGIVITARTTQRKETVNSLIQFQKNTNTVASVISAESIRRSPDRNTGEVLKRTPGASIQEGRFIVVRGLADRDHGLVPHPVDPRVDQRGARVGDLPRRPRGRAEPGGSAPLRVMWSAAAPAAALDRGGVEPPPPLH